MFVYMASLKLAAKPAEALAAWLPAKKPSDNVPMAITNINVPYFVTLDIFPASIPLSIRLAINKGIMISKITSNAANNIVSNESFLYSLICFIKVFTIIDFLSYSFTELHEYL